MPTSRLIDDIDRQMSLRFNLNVNGGYSVCSLFISTIKLEVAFISRFDNRKPKQPDDLVNERVRFKEVLVIDQNGDQLGVKSSREALDIAYDANLDLVCVAPNAKPPVCRIMDFGKYRFEQQKKAREMKKNSKVVTLKETQLSVTIDTHDKNVKLKRTLKWLEEGNKVKVAIRFRGRQLHTWIWVKKLLMTLLKNVQKLVKLKNQQN